MGRSNRAIYALAAAIKENNMKVLVPHIYETLEDCLANLAVAREDARYSEGWTDEHICTAISLEGMVYTGLEEDMVFIEDGVKHGWRKTFGYYTFDKPKH